MERTYGSKSSASAKTTTANIEQTAIATTGTPVHNAVARCEEQCQNQDSSHLKDTNQLAENNQAQSVAGNQEKENEKAILSMILGGGILGILQRVTDVLTVWQGQAPIKDKLNATIALLSQLATLL